MNQNTDWEQAGNENVTRRIKEGVRSDRVIVLIKLIIKSKGKSPAT